MFTKRNIFFIVLFASLHALAQKPDSLSSDSLLLLKIQNEIAQTAPPQQRVAASANPDISVIGDFRGLYRSYGSHNFDALLNEAEFSFQSVVDPYARADFFYSVSQDAATGEFSGEIEEGYITTLSLPAHLRLKAGRFKQMLGRVNTVHPHALPFIDMPDAYVKYFGEEGLKGDGLSLNYLLPNHSFFQDITIEATEVVPGNPSFRRSLKNRFLFLAHLKNFWDLSVNSTLELGFTGMTGENIYRKTTNIGAVDLTYKWKPIQYNTYKSVTFQNEFYYSHAAIDNNKVKAIGFYSLLNVQVSKRTFLAGRYDYTESPYSKKFRSHSGSLTLGWYATEFQKIEIEGKYSRMNEAQWENNFEKKFATAFLRWIFVIGSHGAHAY